MAIFQVCRGVFIGQLRDDMAKARKTKFDETEGFRLPEPL